MERVVHMCVRAGLEQVHAAANAGSVPPVGKRPPANEIFWSLDHRGQILQDQQIHIDYEDLLAKHLGFIGPAPEAPITGWKPGAFRALDLPQLGRRYRRLNDFDARSKAARIIADADEAMRYG